MISMDSSEAQVIADAYEDGLSLAQVTLLINDGKVMSVGAAQGAAVPAEAPPHTQAGSRPKTACRGSF